jgi:hypothetical protein
MYDSLISYSGLISADDISSVKSFIALLGLLMWHNFGSFIRRHVYNLIAARINIIFYHQMDMIG